MGNQVIQSFFSLDSQDRAKFIALLTSRALSGVLDVAGVMLIGLLAGLSVSNLAGSSVFSIFGLSIIPDTHLLIALAITTMVTFLLKAILGLALSRITARFTARVEAQFGERIARHIFSRDLDELQLSSKGEVQWAVNPSTAMATSGILTTVSIVATESFLLVLLLITFLMVDPLSTLFVLAYFGLIILIIQKNIGRKMQDAGESISQKSVELAGVINGMMDTYREISVLGKREYFVEKFKLIRQDVAHNGSIINYLTGVPRYLVETALILGVVAFVALQVTSEEPQTGFFTVGVFVAGGVRIMSSLLPLQNAFSNMRNQIEQSKAAMNLQKEAQTSKRHTAFKAVDSICLPDSEGLSVRLEGVSFSYPNSDVTALDNISFSVEAGQKIAIIGPSGSGKTTLVDLILGLVSPNSGSVELSGVNPKELTRFFPGSISYVPQRPGVMEGTIAENVALGIASASIDYKKVEQALEKAQLLDFVNSLPEGPKTLIGKQSGTLSGGQLQRLGLARALYEKPRLLILDEATSALDAASEAFVSASVNNLGVDVTVITIAHRLSTVQHADNVILLVDGKIEASGTFRFLRKTVPMVSEYVKLMSFEDEVN